MSSQNETTSRNGNVSELEMVGTLLFGSISDVSSENIFENGSKNNVSEESRRMVNLGARIAPAMTRDWEEDSAPVVILSASDKDTISEIVPERKKPSPVLVSTQNELENTYRLDSENQAEETGKKVEKEVMNETAKEVVQETVTVAPSTVSRQNGNRQVMSYFYGASIAVLACCTLFLGWQLYLNKEVATETKTDLATLCAVDETATAETVASAEPMVEPISIPETESVPETAFAPIQHETLPAFANTEVPSAVESVQVADSEIPSFNPNLGVEMQPAPVNPTVGSAVALPEETYPSFNANLAGTATTAPVAGTSVAPIYAQNPNPTAGVNPYVADTNTNWNAGATMDEIPTFNSEISNFNARPTSAPTYAAAPMPTQIQAVPNTYAPQVAPMAPQVGRQAQVPAAPRKLSAPNADMNTIPTTEPMVSQANNSPAEETYPSFNPNVGVDNSIPVSYY